jgi:hypothetical protein
MKRNTKEKIEIDLAEDFTGAHQRHGDDKAFCIMCGRAVKLISFWHAAEYLTTSMTEVARFAEIRQLHRIHNKCGATMICSGSLVKLFQSRQTQPLNPDWTPYKTADFQTNEEI